MSPAFLVRLRFFIACLFAASFFLFCPAETFALPPRPYDAPKADEATLVVPPKPTGYLELSESGFLFVYHPSAHERVRAAIPAVLRKREALVAELGYDVLKSVEIRVAAVPDEMRTLGPVEDVPAYAPALVFSKQKLIVTSLRSPRSLEPTDLAVTLRHSLGHLGLDEAVNHHFVPVWLHEGYAVHSAGEASSSRGQTMLLALLQRRLLPITSLESSFPADAPESSLAYAESAELVRYLTDKPRRPAFSEMLLRLRNGETADDALKLSYDVDDALLDAGFRKDLARRYGFSMVFMASGAIWIFFGVFLAIRRGRERRREKARYLERKAQRPRREEIEESVSVSVRAPPAKSLPSSSLVEPEQFGGREGMGEAMVPETEVPKIEHEGDWHTLH